jgi:hypothetical protein
MPQPDPQQQPPQELQNNDLALCTAPNGYLQPGPQLYNRFSANEARALWARFEHVDQALRIPSPSVDRLNWEPGFQGGLSPYYFHDVPAIEDLEPLLCTSTVAAGGTSHSRL